MKKVLMLALLFPALLDGADVDKAPQLLPRVATREEFFKRYGAESEIKSLGLMPDELRNEVKYDVDELSKYPRETIYTITDAYKQQLKNTKWASLKLLLDGCLQYIGVLSIMFQVMPLWEHVLVVWDTDLAYAPRLEPSQNYIDYIAPLMLSGICFCVLSRAVTNLADGYNTYAFSQMKIIQDELEKIKNNSKKSLCL